MLTILISLYFIFLYDFTLKIETKEDKKEIEYNGLLWCILDRWSIYKYKSNDVPIKWLAIKIVNNF
jgi:hypothetical protein